MAAGRPNEWDGQSSAFETKPFEPHTREEVEALLKTRAHRRAGVTNCHAYRFRHTFAVTYLRSGGDVFTLQAILGHSTLAMVQHYARLVQLDVEKAHRKASPADTWHL